MSPDEHASQIGGHVGASDVQIGGHVVVSDVQIYEHLDGLRVGLALFARREQAARPNYPLGCCLLYTTATALGRQLCGFLHSSLTYMDSLTRDDMLVMIARPEADPKDADDTVLMVARYLSVSLDALPCAVFFLPSREHAERAVLRLDGYIPVVDNEHLVKAIHAIAEAARRSAQAPDHERLATLREELTLAHQRAFPEAPEPAWPGAEGRQNVTAFASVLAALAAAAGVALGR